MEDGWILAQALAYYKNDLSKALPLFDEIRVPYYRRMYAHLKDEARRKNTRLEGLESPNEEERVRVKVVKAGKNMEWIYENDIGRVWEEAVERIEYGR